MVDASLPETSRERCPGWLPDPRGFWREQAQVARLHVGRHGAVLLAVVAAVGGAFLIATITGATENGSCGTAVSIWLKRGQLPLPRLSAGSKDLVLRTNWLAAGEGEDGLDGCYRVALYRRADEDRLVAEYDVGWHGRPARYRLVSATDRLSGRPLAVDGVPELTQDDLDRATPRGRVTWNPFR